MNCNVFANGNEIACKKGGNKVIAEFPDVCLSPPSPPAGPIPVPYPDSSFSKDMKSGSKTVKIKGGEVMLKDKSFYKSSPLGDEAATRSFGANVITHTITGKTHFIAWSMDVKFEGKNVDRHMDMTTSNHNPPPGGTGPTGMSAGATSPTDEEKCKELATKALASCTELKERIADLEEDELGLFKIAKSKPHPSLPKGTGSWDGHVHQAEGVQNRLRDNVEAYDKAECESPHIPKSCRDLGYASLPSRPKKK